MIREFSAGGIVFRKDLPAGRHGGPGVLVLIAQHSHHHGWVFPKGHIGDTVHKEKPEDAALREVQEETGIVGRILHPLSPISYWYQMHGEKRKKEVQYYLMEYVSGDTTDHDFEMENVVWLPIAEIGQKLSFPSDKKVWQEAQKMIESLQ